MDPILILVIILVLIALFIWLGFNFKPSPFQAFPQPAGVLQSMPLPQGLPTPVERFYRTLYGEQIPLITSAVLTGRATLRLFGIGPFHARFRFTHIAGRSYRHYIEVTFWGIPLMRVNERYLDGEALAELPMGTERGPKLNQAANLGMWAETMAFPAVFLSDPRLHWEAVDDESALLAVPFESGEEHFIVRFNPETGQIRYTEVMRYQGEKSLEKSLWITTSVAEDWHNGQPLRTVGAATWLQDGRPWAVFTTEDFRFNVDVTDYIRQHGI